MEKHLFSILFSHFCVLDCVQFRILNNTASSVSIAPKNSDNTVIRLANPRETPRHKYIYFITFRRFVSLDELNKSHIF